MNLFKDLLSYVYAYILCAIIVSAAPPALIIWVIWRTISFVFPEWIYQLGDDALYFVHNRLMLLFFELVVGTEICFYGDGAKLLAKKENVLYFSNHRSSMDWLIATMIANKQGSLGRIRFIMKDVFQLLPLYGFISMQHGSIFVNRRCFKPKDILPCLNYLKNAKIPTWLVIYPEGTRFNRKYVELIEKSRQYALQRGLPVLNHHLTPRSKGLYVILSHLRNHLDAVYDVTIITESRDKLLNEDHLIPSIIGFLRLQQPVLHVHVNRFTISQIPNMEHDVALWLHNQFVQKDKLVTSFYSRRSRRTHWGTGIRTYLHPKDVIWCSVLYISMYTVLLCTVSRTVCFCLLPIALFLTYSYVILRYGILYLHSLLNS